MANTFLTPSIIAREALLILENNLVATNLFHRGHAEQFTGAKVGDTISVRQPASFTAQEYAGSITLQNVTQVPVPFVVEKHFDVSLAVTAKQWTMSLASFREEIIDPVMVALAQGVDNYVMSKALTVPNFVGTAGDPPDSLADVVAVEKKLNDLKVPMNGRFAILNSTAKADMMANVTQVLQADQRGDGGLALRTASIGNFLGIDWYMSQNVPSQDGNSPSSWVVNNGPGYAAGDTSMTIGSGSGNPAVGDVFTVDGDSVQHVVTAYSTNVVTFSPALGAAVSNAAALTFIGDHVANIAGHPFGLTVAIVPLELPRGAANAEYIGDRGLGVRVVYGYDMDTKSDTISFDLLVGAKVQQAPLLTRILG